MSTPKDRTLVEDFGTQYERLQSPVLKTIERNVCGCVYGGTSWTTRKEADRLCDLLDLSSGQRLLEIGAGSGWPALYLARKTDSQLVLVDLPFKGLRIAAQRANDDGLEGGCRIAAADGAALPFVERGFDAVSHSDVLCCLDNKFGVLKECRRVIRGGGTMVFTVISIAPGLSTADHEHAVEFGPPYVDSASDYTTLLGRSDWRIRAREDLTGEYTLTSRQYLRELEVHRDELENLLGQEDYATQLTRMRTKVDAIEQGLFRRELYVADGAG